MNHKQLTHSSRITLFMSLLFILITMSCDMGSYHPIARALDPFEPLGPLAKTWLAATGDGSASDHYAKLLTLQNGTPQPNDTGSYVFTEIHDSNAMGNVTKITVVRGIYRVIDADTIEMQPHVEFSGRYLYTNDPSNNPDPLDRQGESFDLDFTYTSGTPDTITIPAAVGEIFYSLDGSGGVLDRIYKEGNSTNKTHNFARLNQIDVYLSQVIIPGFGGAGMMAYWNNPTPFGGMIAGSVTLNMHGNLLRPTVDFTYDEMVNFKGLSLSGVQGSVANASGDGSLSDTVDITLDSGANIFQASVGYDGILIEGTVPSSGSYTVTVDSVTENVDHTVLNPGNLFFTELIPSP
ncbi:MAG: hypothetical protein KAH21_08530 [Spirochaetaceae bacterium]|nr:hypothetical protein [Spirochaetaceae bacterium]